MRPLIAAVSLLALSAAQVVAQTAVPAWQLPLRGREQPQPAPVDPTPSPAPVAPSPPVSRPPAPQVVPPSAPIQTAPSTVPRQPPPGLNWQQGPGTVIVTPPAPPVQVAPRPMPDAPRVSPQTQVPRVSPQGVVPRVSDQPDYVAPAPPPQPQQPPPGLNWYPAPNQVQRWAPPPPRVAPQPPPTPAPRAPREVVPAPTGGASVFMPGTGVRRMEDVRARRQRFNESGTTVIREPGRVITRERGQTFLRHDENARFGRFGAPISQERRGGEIWTTWARPGGGQLVSVTDLDGRLLRRIRRPVGGGEHVIVDNGWRRPRHGVRPVIVILPPIEMLNPGELTILNDGREAETFSSTWSLGPVVPLDQVYELDQVRFSPTLRSRMRAVELGGVSFDSGSWSLDQADLNALSLVASAMQNVLTASPNEIFLVEGHTGRGGNEIDNLSLSDRRAEAVAEALTQLGIPPENLVVQGYGDTVARDEGRSRSARDDDRILVRRITPLLAPAS